MKRVLSFLLFAATSLVVVGCLQEKALVHGSPRISIRAYIPEDPLSKVLHLAWQAKDNSRVINADNPAWLFFFSGKAIAGDQFNIICPGSYASVAEAEAGKTLFFI